MIYFLFLNDFETVKACQYLTGSRVVCLVLKLSVKADAIKGLSDEEKMSLRNACVRGELDPSESAEVWRDLYGICVNCEMHREQREIGAYNYMDGRKEEVINIQSDECLKYGYNSTYHWCSWVADRVEEWYGNEKVWKKSLRPLRQ